MPKASWIFLKIFFHPWITIELHQFIKKKIGNFLPIGR